MPITLNHCRQLQITTVKTRGKYTKMKTKDGKQDKKFFRWEQKEKKIPYNPKGISIPFQNYNNMIYIYIL